MEQEIKGLFIRLPGNVNQALWNWIALLPEEHEQQHRQGWDKFLQIYPHLQGRVNRARSLARKLELEFKISQKSSMYLALEALGN